MDNIFNVHQGVELVAYVLRLISFKHSRGRQVDVCLNRHLVHSACLVQALTDYLTVRSRVAGYLFVKQDGKLATSDWLGKLFGQLLQRVGEDPLQYA